MPSVICDGSGNFDDGVLTKFHSVPATVRDATSASSFRATSTISMMNHGKVFSNTYVHRALTNFDLSGNDSAGDSLSGNTVESATITVDTYANLTGFSAITAQTSNLLYILKTDGISSSFDSADFNAIDGWVSSGSYDGEVTVYGSTNEAANTTLTFTLSSECVGDINSAISAGEDFPIICVTQDDYLNNVGVSGGIGFPNTGTGLFANFDGCRLHTKESAADKCFKLNLTYASTAVAQNAVFFGTNF